MITTKNRTATSVKVRYRLLQRRLAKSMSHNLSTNAMLRNPFQDSAPPPVSLQYSPPQPFFYAPNQMQKPPYPEEKPADLLKSSYTPPQGFVDVNVPYSGRHPSFNIGAWHYIGYRSNDRVPSHDAYPLCPTPPYSTYPNHYFDMSHNDYYSAPPLHRIDSFISSSPPLEHRSKRIRLQSIPHFATDSGNLDSGKTMSR